MLDWDTFTIFAGEAVLNKKIFTWDFDQFNKWLGQLADCGDHQLHNCGIPLAHVPKVVELLDAFFKVKPGDKTFNPQNLIYIRTQTIDGSLLPVNVVFGNSTMAINDAATALGYILRIASSSVDHPGPRSFGNYALPLLAIYARCIYLLYHGNNVPMMSCIMYGSTLDLSNPFPVLLGSSYTSGPSGKNNSDKGAETGLLMDKWRKSSVVGSGLAYYQPPRTLPLAPVVKDHLGIAFYRAFLGNSVAIGIHKLFPPALGTDVPKAHEFSKCFDEKYAIENIFDPAVVKFRKAWENTPTAQQDIAPLEMALTVDTKNTGSGVQELANQIQAARNAIIDLRWTANFNEAAPEYVAAIKAFLKLYFIPHMFVAKQNDPTVPDINTPELKFPDPALNLGLEQMIDGLWHTCRVKTLQLLDLIFYWGSTKAPSFQATFAGDYGRCAETHPLVSLLPNTTPARILPVANDNPQLNLANAETTPVRGFAFKSRRFDNSAASDPSKPTTRDLAVKFNSDKLNSIHRVAAIYRLPCNNCNVLLKVMDVPIGEQDFNADLFAIDPDGAKTTI